MSGELDVDSLRLELDRHAGLQPAVREHLLRAFTAVNEQIAIARGVLRFASSEQAMHWFRRVELLRDEHLARILEASLQSAAMDSARELLRRVSVETVGALQSPAVLASERRNKIEELLGSVQMRAVSVDEDLAQISQLVTAVETASDEARSALARANEADTARREAMTVAATTGDVELSEKFRDLEARETLAAGQWTTAAIATTFVGLLLGVLMHMFAVFPSEAAALIYPLAVAVGFTGLAAYFARLGGHRRHTAQWAKSIGVQLDSYDKFIHHADEASRGAIFDRFAARVLGDPPARNAKNEVAGLSVSDIVALVSKQT